MTTNDISLNAQAVRTELAGITFKSLYTVAGVSTLILLLYSLATLLIVAITGGQPATVEGIFAMLQENRLVGLLRLDLLTVFLMPLYYVLFLSFLVALWRTNPVYAGLAALLAFAGLTLFLATPSVFSYLFLSDQYVSAATGAQRAQLIAAGNAIYASDMWHGTGALIGGMLLQIGAVLISVVMLKGSAFGKATAWVGILTHGLDLAHIFVWFIAPALGNIIMFVAGPLYLIWFPMIALRLFPLSRRGA
jgi:hypothetical protein